MSKVLDIPQDRRNRRKLLLGQSNVLGPAFFERPTEQVARDLLGKVLCRGLEEQSLRLSICEIEAYAGFKDRASHAFRGKTPRNQVMFGSGGYWYVYLCYGIHWMLNVVTEPEHFPAAILIRGAGALRGPGRLTRRLAIDKRHYGLAVAPSSALWIEEDATRVPDHEVETTPRVGVGSAGPFWVAQPLRYVWKRSAD